MSACECASACLPRAVWVEFVESTPPTRVDKTFQWRLATTHRGEWRVLIHLICIRLCIVNNFYAYFRLYHERLIGQAIKSHRVWFGKLLTTYLRYNFMPFVGSRQSIIVCHCRTAHTLPPLSTFPPALMNYGIYLMPFDCVVLMTNIFDIILADIWPRVLAFHVSRFQFRFFGRY